ncbi:MAG: 5-oxoprolinase subunit B family protein [Ilumatobacteraceae bacterium]
MRLLPCGPRAVLAEFATLDEVMAAAAEWRAAHHPGVVEVVPAAATVLVVHDGRLDPAVLVAPTGGEPPAGGPLVEIPVRYEGEDLDEVAAATGLSVDDVVAAHAGAAYRVAFCGFMPGFSYLVGLDPRLVLPRRPTPRTRVPRGSVAIAAGFAAVYPRESPGGWHLLGATDVPMWDEAAESPALLPPGTRVRFVAR